MGGIPGIRFARGEVRPRRIVAGAGKPATTFGFIGAFPVDLTTAPGISFFVPTRPARRSPPPPHARQTLMLIRIGYELVFDVPTPTPIMFLLYLHPSRGPSLRQGDRLVVEPAVKIHEFTDVFGNRCGWIHAPAGKVRFTNDAIVRDSALPDPIRPAARQHPVEELPPEVLQFLLASRYCEVDRMSQLAWDLFGALPPGWSKVQAVCN